MQEELSPIRARRKEYENRIGDVYDILKKGSEIAKHEAEKTLAEVKHAMKAALQVETQRGVFYSPCIWFTKCSIL